MPNMTLRRLAPMIARARGAADPAAVTAVIAALEKRATERRSSKLTRRLRRKFELGRAGAF